VRRGSVALRQSSRPERRRAVAIGSDRSDGCRLVKHWLSQTPSIMLASANARSSTVVPFWAVMSNWSSARWSMSSRRASECAYSSMLVLAIRLFQRPYGTVASQSAQTDP
jgi:hypothetical protein